MNEDFGNIEEMLRRHRAEPTDAERERIEQKVALGGEEPQRARVPLRRLPRLAFTAAAAAGALMLGAGTTYALTGFDRAPSASSAQYPTTGTVSVQGETVPPPTSTTTPTTTTGTQTVAPANVPAAAVQPAQQQAASNKVVELPFTGLIVFPVLAIGLLLLIGGLVLRARDTRRNET
jgi:hypothetical protein